MSVVAVVAQQSAAVRRYVEDNGLPFHILIDSTRDITKQYGVWHRLALDAWNIARPALFVIDRDGILLAIFVGETQEEFPSSDEIDAIVNTL